MEYIKPLDGVAADAPYVDDNPQAGIDGSVVPAAFFNAMQAEVLAVIEGAGLTPTAANMAQLYEAILALISAAITPGEDPGSWALANRMLTAGKGLTGGGDLTADRTFTVALNTLDAIAGAMADDDLFAVHDTSATKTTKITWGDLKAAIASAISIGGVTVPGLNDVGSYRSFSFNSSQVSTPSITVGATVGGTVLQSGLAGAWRCHGVWSSQGTTQDQLSQTYTVTTFLMVRIS